MTVNNKTAVKSNSDVETRSQAEIVASLSEAERRALFAGLSKTQLQELYRSWAFWARPKQMLPSGDWGTWFIVSGRGFGKSLPISIKIPTPNGFTTMKNINVGDQVFDETGSICNVTFVTPIQLNRVCYEILFDDGKTIVADADHQWSVATRASRKKNAVDPEKFVFTTEQMREKLYVGSRRDSNLSIDLCGPVEYLEKDLAVDPYIYGRDLCHRHDKLESDYLQGSVAQRLSLVQGMMDASGQVSVEGHCEFCSTSEIVSKGFYELTLSLGIKSSFIVCDTMCEGRRYANRYRVTFTTDMMVATLDHLVSRLPKEVDIRTKRRYIRNIKAVDSVPVKCIQVDSPNSLFLAGEYFIVTHNTRTGAETVREWVKQGYRHIALVGQSKADVRDTMLMGESGLMTICAKDEGNVPEYISSKRLVQWPNGAQAHLYSGDEPDQLRGPQHDKAWVDELVKFKAMRDCWDNLQFGLRLGDNPQAIVTTTPKPYPLIKELLQDEDTFVTAGSSYENIGNLAPKFIKAVIKKYEGTRTGRQELYGEVLSNVEGALWKFELIDSLRIDTAPPMYRIVVAIDPAVSNNEDSDETGLVVCGIDRQGHGYLLEDFSGKYTAKEWAELAIKKYKEWKADRIIGEKNNGGDLIETVLRLLDNNVSYEAVWASRGKQTRAEPVAAIYEKNRAHHVGPSSNFEFLETELCEWMPAESKTSPNRLDALVWGLSYLMLEEEVKKGKLKPLSAEFRRMIG